MPTVYPPATRDLLQLPTESLRHWIQDLVSDHRLNALAILEFNIERAFRQACYAGDLARVQFFLTGLPSELDPISRRLLKSPDAVSCAAYGSQLSVIRYLCALQHDAELMAYDYRYVLELLDLITETAADGASSYQIPESRDASTRCSSLGALVSVASEKESLELLRAVEERLERALDNQIVYQIGR